MSNKFSANKSYGISSIDASVFGSTAKSPGMLMGLGILLVILGGIGVAGGAKSSLLSVDMLGLLLCFGGFLQAIFAFMTSGWKSKGIQLILAIFYIVAGFYIWAYPVPALEMITLWFAALYFVSGLLRMALSFQYRSFGNWLWIFLSGALSILFGIMIFNDFPSDSFWFLGLIISVELLLQGASLFMMGLMAKEAS